MRVMRLGSLDKAFERRPGPEFAQCGAVDREFDEARIVRQNQPQVADFSAFSVVCLCAAEWRRRRLDLEDGCC